MGESVVPKGRDKDPDSSMRLGSVKVSPVRLPDATEEHGVDAGLFIDWRRELATALPEEGSKVHCFSYLNVLEGKLPRDMTIDELKENYVEVRNAKVKEIPGPFDLGCFKRWPRYRSKNFIDVRWVIAWKVIEDNVGVKCRLIVRGFNDKLQDLDTCAGTTSRSGQRLVNVVVAENPGFILFTFDVSQVFAKGMTFEEFSAFTRRSKGAFRVSPENRRI